MATRRMRRRGNRTFRIRTPSKFFVCYRRSDEPAFARLVYEALAEAFPAGSLFIDVAGMMRGHDFVVQIEKELSRVDVVLVIVGPGWLALSEDGRSRLEAEDDSVRVEIETATRLEKTVIPVLVRGATMPAAHELPESIRGFTRLDAAKVRHDSFDRDMDDLIAHIAGESHAGTQLTEPLADAEAVFTAFVGATLTLLVGTFWYPDVLPAVVKTLVTQEVHPASIVALAAVPSAMALLWAWFRERADIGSWAYLAMLGLLAVPFLVGMDGLSTGLLGLQILGLVPGALALLFRWIEPSGYRRVLYANFAVIGAISAIVAGRSTSELKDEIDEVVAELRDPGCGWLTSDEPPTAPEDAVRLFGTDLEGAAQEMVEQCIGPKLRLAEPLASRMQPATGDPPIPSRLKYENALEFDTWQETLDLFAKVPERVAKLQGVQESFGEALRGHIHREMRKHAREDFDGDVGELLCDNPFMVPEVQLVDALGALDRIGGETCRRNYDSDPEAWTTAALGWLKASLRPRAPWELNRWIRGELGRLPPQLARLLSKSARNLIRPSDTEEVDTRELMLIRCDPKVPGGCEQPLAIRFSVGVSPDGSIRYTRALLLEYDAGPDASLASKKDRMYGMAARLQNVWNLEGKLECNDKRTRRTYGYVFRSNQGGTPYVHTLYGEVGHRWEDGEMSGVTGTTYLTVRRGTTCP